MPLESNSTTETESKEPAGCRRYKGKGRYGESKLLFGATSLLQLRRHFLSESSISIEFISSAP